MEASLAKISGSWRPARSSAAIRGANSRAQKSRTVATSCSWSGVSERSSTCLRYFVGDGFGDGVGQTTGLALALGEGLVLTGVVFAVGEGEGDGQLAGVGCARRSFG